MSQGCLCLVLHAHLPFIRHPEYDQFLEETWLFEAVAETYLPLLRLLDRLAEDRVPARLALSLSPTLLGMLADDLLRERCRLYLKSRLDLAQKEVHRTRYDRTFHRLALFYREYYSAALHDYTRRYGSDLARAFRRLRDAGLLDLLTTAATHAYLPLLRAVPAAVHAQVAVGAQAFRKAFGCAPRGMWLPECGYYPGLEEVLAAHGLRYFCLETHGLLHAQPGPRHGVLAPVRCPNGVAAFGRDPESSRQVWSAAEGYPGDFDYRDFYRDVGFDLDLNYLQPYLPAPPARSATGFKYYRITGPTGPKEPYDPARARHKAELHARHFLETKREQLARQGPGRPAAPCIVAPFDAELFGHWWFEGAHWLETLLRAAARPDSGLALATPADCLAGRSDLETVTPSASSWGMNGYNEYWLNDETDYLYPYLHAAAERMQSLAHARARRPPAARVRRALNQAARNLLLAQSSDWPFIMKAATNVDYARKRVRDHLARFNYLAQSITRNTIDLRRLQALEILDNIFPWIDYRVFDQPPAARRRKRGG